MPRRRLIALGLALACGCANRAEEVTRSAWDDAVRAQGAGKGSDGGDGRGHEGDADEDDVSAWREIGRTLGEIAETMASGVPTVDAARLAEHLCGREPERVRENGELTFHCIPQPPIELLGEILEIEMDERGVVGLVASDLNEEESGLFVHRALERLAELCALTWTAIAADAENAHKEFYTCPVASGPVLAVGRFPRDLAANQWQFSLVVLGPG